MAGQSNIEWTIATWNPTTGCTKTSPGCENCYAERFAKRLRAMGNPRYTNGFNLTVHEDLLTVPLEWKTPKIIFVDSMSDLFHEEVPLSFIERVFDTMKKADVHTFQVLTKRTERLLEVSSDLEYPPNVWVGVSVENNDYIYRIDHLRSTEAAVKFISFEPLLGPIDDLDLTGIDWVIVGGESGPRSRVMSKEWVRGIRDKCLSDNVPFFFKQWGGFNKKKAGRLLDGRLWAEMPELQYEYPLFTV
jgi:protein gp37